MSTWLFDLGNSRLKFAAPGDGSVGGIHHVDHDGSRFADGWEQQLPPRFDTAWIASVGAPGLTTALVDGLCSRCRRVSFVRTQRSFGGVRIAYADPARLGVDRFLALLAAHARASGPSLVVGVGTALTIDLLDADGVHRGGRIAPSPTLMRDSLHARAPQLPARGGSYAAFADETASALASGCEGAALALIAQSMQAATAMLGTTPRVLLHGGGAPALLPASGDAIIAPALVLEGLALWARALDPADGHRTHG
ncbi:type III pantothenate kinase [Cognatiluteimonas profundi]|uniref:type III pantothenate kinase n=1 Tax=Cognatiluteimonas profundi TaxID=2594501 RepID=UPI00131D43CC|nr:type III pantothenate kinase [Lysobacter profundi]